MIKIKEIYRNKLLWLLLIAFIGGALQSCADKRSTIVYINSYHSDFPPSQQITRGVLDNLPEDSFEVLKFFMDTKRNPSESYIKARADVLLDSIKKLDPDVLIVSDDNAMKYLVVPHLQGADLPVVFCGVNWSIEQYELHGQNITGILEILPVADLVITLKPYYPEMKKLLVLNENTTTSRKTQPILDTLLGNLGLEVSQELVSDFESWKAAFIRANETHDFIYMQTKGAIRDWDDTAARSHLEKYIKVPIGTCEEFMMPYSVLGLTQLSKEQGEKAAEMAKQIINGADPADIPVSKNTESNIWINQDLAERIGFEPDEKLQNRATVSNY